MNTSGKQLNSSPHPSGTARLHNRAHHRGWAQSSTPKQSPLAEGKRDAADWLKFQSIKRDNDVSSALAYFNQTFLGSLWNSGPVETEIGDQFYSFFRCYIGYPRDCCNKDAGNKVRSPFIFIKTLHGSSSKEVNHLVALTLTICLLYNSSCHNSYLAFVGWEQIVIFITCRQLLLLCHR